MYIPLLTLCVLQQHCKCICAEWYYFTLHTATRTYDFGSLSALTVLAWVSALHRAISTTSHPVSSSATATSDTSAAVRTTRSSSTGSSTDSDRERGPLAQAQFLFQQVYRCLKLCCV